MSSSIQADLVRAVDRTIPPISSSEAVRSDAVSPPSPTHFLDQSHEDLDQYGRTLHDLQRTTSKIQEYKHRIREHKRKHQKHVDRYVELIHNGDYTEDELLAIKACLQVLEGAQEECLWHYRWWRTARDGLREELAELPETKKKARAERRKAARAKAKTEVKYVSPTEGNVPIGEMPGIEEATVSGWRCFRRVPEKKRKSIVKEEVHEEMDEEVHDEGDDEADSEREE
ncbi:MAG: hypothetical protein M1827_005235 [Pycnora praestabilis]|nr:MAG: hypothetical protein M1827_005235 [Pycnora praestabilis]